MIIISNACAINIIDGVSMIVHDASMSVNDASRNLINNTRVTSHDDRHMFIVRATGARGVA